MKRWSRRHRLLFSLRVGLILAGGMLLFGVGQEVVVQPPVVVDHSGETWQFGQVRGVSTTEVGVYGYTDASEHCGVFGHSPAGIGVKGASNGTDGVQGWTSAPNASGVLGYSNVAAGVSGWSSGNDGLVGISISPNPDHAALRARNEGSGPAIVCEGDLIVTGAIQGGGISQFLNAEQIEELVANLITDGVFDVPFRPVDTPDPIDGIIGAEWTNLLAAQTDLETNLFAAQTELETNLYSLQTELGTRLIDVQTEVDHIEDKLCHFMEAFAKDLGQALYGNEEVFLGIVPMRCKAFHGVTWPTPEPIKPAIDQLEAKLDQLSTDLDNMWDEMNWRFDDTLDAVAANAGAITALQQHIGVLYHLANYDRAANNRVEEKLNQLLGALGVVDLPPAPVSSLITMRAFAGTRVGTPLPEEEGLGTRGLPGAVHGGALVTVYCPNSEPMTTDAREDGSFFVGLPKEGQALLFRFVEVTQTVDGKESACVMIPDSSLNP